jgi:hypothetical protein
LGRHNEALTLAQAAVAVLDKALGPERQSTKDSASTCADALDELGRTDEAVRAARTLWADGSSGMIEKRRNFAGGRGRQTWRAIRPSW